MEQCICAGEAIPGLQWSVVWRPLVYAIYRIGWPRPSPLVKGAGSTDLIPVGTIALLLEVVEFLPVIDLYYTTV